MPRAAPDEAPSSVDERRKSRAGGESDLFQARQYLVAALEERRALR
jgi:hypothetical protein